MMECADSDVPLPTSEQSKSIRAISKDNVHRICSGQVVLSLAVAVKELVENSLDAGATLVEVKLVQQGLESVEVSDNGSGVEENNLEGMTAKYHTSKLRDFVDLQNVETFGFRGEALSSLCALAEMTVTTRHKTSDVATKVTLDHEGKIKSQVNCARGEGTTVTLNNLFETLPVRRRDFVKNIKKEFNKMCQILQAYCLVAKGARIICSNLTTKGHKTTILQTHGSMDLLSNISAVFGSRQISDILEIQCPLRDSNGQFKEESSLFEEIQTELGDSVTIIQQDVTQLLNCNLKLEGQISSCSHGCGRSSKDRQFFYVNSRPCDLKNISKVANDVYHRYNTNQFPFIYLNIITDRQSVDVNLTPDKRQLLLNNEKVLVAVFKMALTATFGAIPSTYKMQNTTITSMIGNASKIDQNDDTNEDVVPESSTQKFSQVLSQWKNTGSTEGYIPKTAPLKRKITDDIAVRTLKMQKIQEYLTTVNEESSVYKSEDSFFKDTTEDGNDSEREKKLLDISFGTDTNKDIPSSDSSRILNIPNLEEDNINVREEIKSEDHESDASQNIVELDDDETDNDFPKMKCNVLKTSMSEIELLLRAEDNLTEKTKAHGKLERLRFKCEINPSKNQTAEEELQKEISKSHFAKMQILGQFNLGFIIAKLESDVFIVDQHASDEKYNFETLQKTTQLHHQPLTIPQPLELTAVNEMVLMDHIAVFEKNGFKFDINAEGLPTKKVRLLGKPFSKNWEFGKEDIDELIFMLQDAPEGTMCRPSRIRSMFASRACRKSVMIGQSLKKSAMETLIRHMGEIDQPWNCPHGRPTMRHLINIAMLLDTEEDSKTAEEC